MHTVPYAPDKVWRALPAVYDSLGIPVSTLDPAKRVIGNEAFKVRGRLKSTPLSRYIDCGSSTQIGPNADSYDVVLTLVTNVRPAEGGATTVNNTFSAVARPANFSQDYSQCSSRSTMETRFLTVLNSVLGK